MPDLYTYKDFAYVYDRLWDLEHENFCLVRKVLDDVQSHHGKDCVPFVI